jgi:hypothetical protein
MNTFTKDKAATVSVAHKTLLINIISDALKRELNMKWLKKLMQAVITLKDSMVPTIPRNPMIPKF